MRKILVILSLIAVVLLLECNSINTPQAAIQSSHNEVLVYIVDVNKINENEYVLGEYDCRHFSMDLVRDLRNEFPGIDARVAIVDSSDTLHAIVVVRVDGEVYLIEPQTDERAYFEIGKHPAFDYYCECLLRRQK